MHRYLFISLTAFLICLPLAAQTVSPETNPPVATPPPAPPTEATAPVTPPPSTAPTTPQPLATAVLNFQGSDETMDKQGAEVGNLLEADLSTSDHALMVERQEVEKILNEQELGKSGLVSADSAAKVGSLTGAQVLVTGRFFAVGNQYMIVGKIISTETSRVYGVTTSLTDLGNLPQAVQDLSAKVDGVLATHRDVLLPVEETPEQRMARLKALLGNRPLPSVMVTITERDYTQPTIDPAAQTEIMMQLQQLGFPIINPDEAHKKADILIAGEAFSELGARHGNLVSSVGRIEIKITRLPSHELIWTDRETRVAVDLGSRAAGKEALQKAAGILVERMLLKLTK